MGWADSKALRENNLDFIRFTLASAVVYAHSFMLAGATNSFEPLYYLTRRQMTPGELAVDWFFVISGFLITHSWLHSKSTWDYFRRRILRIYPGFILVTLIGGLIIAPQVSASAAAGFFSRGQIFSLVRSMTTLHYQDHLDAFPGNPVHVMNGSLWSIEIEGWCYVGVALTGAVGLLVRPRVLAVVLVSAILVSLTRLVIGWEPSGRLAYGFTEVFGFPTGWIRLLPYFLSGMVFYLFRERIPQSTQLFGIAIVLLVIGVIVPFGLTVSLPIAGTYALFWTAFHPVRGIKDWMQHVGGDYSYGVYLYAFPIQQFVVSRLGSSASPARVFAISLPLATLAGIASYQLCEKWFLRRKRKTKTAEPASNPANLAACAVPTLPVPEH